MRNSLIEKIYTKKSINRIKRKVDLLGIYNKINPIEFMNIRLIISIVIFFLTLVTLNVKFLR